MNGVIREERGDPSEPVRAQISVLRIKILPWKVQLFSSLVFPCFSWTVLSVLY